MYVLLAVFFFGFLRWLKFTASTRFALSLCFYWVACVGANDRLLRLSWGGLHRHSFFLIFVHARRRQDKP